MAIATNVEPERVNMRSPQLAETLTASEPISTALEDGSVVEGTLGFHPSGRGRFKVTYGGKSKMETRSYIGWNTCVPAPWFSYAKWLMLKAPRQGD